MTVLPNDRALETQNSPIVKEGVEPSLLCSTIQKEVSLKGAGLFSGAEVNISFLPAPQNTGIIFQRMDLPQKPFIPAALSSVRGTPRCTILGEGETTVQTVEHLLSALRALQIDNMIVQINGPEIPIFDGSSHFFVEILEKAGIHYYPFQRKYYRLKQTVSWAENNISLVAIPSEEFRVSYTLHYPHSNFIGTQFYSFLMDPVSYKKDIALSRTFSLYEEVLPMLEKGFLKGGGLENGVVVKDDTVLNPEGLRYKNEMVRHKILDLIGDLSLIGIPFFAHIIAIRSGHSSNIAFAKKLRMFLQREEKNNERG